MFSKLTSQLTASKRGIMIKFTLIRIGSAPIETVFDALTDHRGIAGYIWWFQTQYAGPRRFA